MGGLPKELGSDDFVRGDYYWLYTSFFAFIVLSSGWNDLILQKDTAYSLHIK